jgi:hypothetical protein
MIKYAKIVNEETKQCEVGTGTNAKFYQSIGMTEMDVEQGYNGQWYIAGHTPVEPEPTEREQMQERIVRLKQALTDSDYKVIKCAEAQMAGVELPYNIAELHAERQELRDMINELELIVDNGIIYV